MNININLNLAREKKSLPAFSEHNKQRPLAVLLVATLGPINYNLLYYRRRPS